MTIDEPSQDNPFEANNSADIFDEAALPVIVHDWQRPLYVNHRWAALLGCTISELLSRGLGELRPDTAIGRGDRPWDEKPSDRQLERHVYRYAVRHKSGAILYVQVLGNPIIWMGRNAIQETVISHSCSQPTDASHRTLNDGVKQRFFEALDGFSEGFALYDKDESLVICNKKFRDMYPTLHDMLQPGRTMYDILKARVERGLVPDAIGREDAWIDERLQSLRTENGSYDILNQQGRWLHTRQQRTADGGTLVTAIDISDRKALEIELARHRDHLEEMVGERTRQLERALDKERELNGLQRQFVSMVSHEFRTPLAIIDGTIQRLVRKPDKVTAKRIGEMGKKIRGSVARLIGLIESVLDAAHLEEGRIKYQPDACAIRDILLDLRNTYQEAYPEHRIDLDADDLPAQITADERLLRQIFSNLVSNAVKYSPDGSVVEIRGRCADDGTFRVDVQDNGVGIPEAERSRLFERFFRASTSTGITGTGIGLHLTQYFVQLHQGAIDMESIEGEGSTFTVQLPIHAPDEPIQSDDVAT